MTKQEQHKEYLAHWEKLIQARVESGMTIKDWCATNGVSERKYAYWVWQVNKERSTPEETSPADEASESITFLELQPPAEQAEPVSKESPRVAALIRLGSMEVEIFQDATEAFLRQLLAVMRNA